MKFQESPIRGVFVVDLEFETDARGFFARTFDKKEFARAGFAGDWVQINHSYNKTAGIFRGFHFHRPPMRERKLIYCVAGSAIDFVVDLRRGSPTFLKSFSVELSAKNHRQVLIPPGVAHGFLSTADETSLVYHHSESYDKNLDSGVRHDDPKLGFTLPRPAKIVSTRDQGHPLLAADFSGYEF